MTAAPTFALAVAKSKADIDACVRVRIEVFIDEQKYSMDDEIDEHDNSGDHVSFLVSDTSVAPPKPVGTVRLIPAKAKLTRLAVLKDYRKYGLGKQLVNALEGYVVSHPDEMTGQVKVGADGKKRVQIKIHSQVPVKPFYAKLGYTPVGDEFDEDGTPHQKMVQDFVVDQ
ncbi:putative protein YyaT [Vanrija pseudolonga]|uniref:Purtative protein YyaT n=1 Tax=Vanrija pseudolonga TaxID=143232 RepID=A0AAF1BIW1_9TREE|nr:purtative protein YyaT [Vanrija pseudolonga]